MINSLLYIVGAPGVGKSTVTRELTSGWDTYVNRHAAIPHSVLSHPVSDQIHGVELGVPRDSFPGTDALAMDIGPRALRWLQELPAPFALGEGSRLATRPFLGGLAAVGVPVTLVRLTADEELLEQRWKARGSKQNPSWRKGAATRAARVGDWFMQQANAGARGFRLYLDLDVTELKPEAVADRIRDAFPLIDLRESAA